MIENLEQRRGEFLTFDTGAEQSAKIDELIDNYFRNELLRRGLTLDNPFVKIESRVLARSLEIDGGQTDDYLHELFVHDQVTNLALDRRDDFNRHQLSFYCLDPAPVLQEQIAEIIRQEN